MDIALEFIGFCVALYWVIGFLIFTFIAKVYIHPGAPIGAKVSTVFFGSWHMPLIVFKTGIIPLVVVTPADDPEAEEKANEWLRSHCPCPQCRRRRGEIE